MFRIDRAASKTEYSAENVLIVIQISLDLLPNIYGSGYALVLSGTKVRFERLATILD